MFHRPVRLSALLIALSGTVFTAVAEGAVLDFSGNVCATATGACTNSASIAQTYGDVTGQLDIIYDYNIDDLTPAGAMAAGLKYYTRYGDLVDVAFGGANDAAGTAEIFFQPVDGYSVSVTGFALDPFLNREWLSQYSIRDGLGNLLFSSGQIRVGPSHLDVVNSWTSSTGIRIQWGPSAFNVAIDNVNYAVSPVPLPATGWLLLTAVGAGTMRWRRSTSQRRSSADSGSRAP